MNVLQVMGCTSDQYASMERYLVGKARALSMQGSQLIVIYESTPKNLSFVSDLREAGGVLKQSKLQGPRDFSFYSHIHSLIRVHEVNVVHTYFTPTCHYLALALRLSGFHKVVRSAANMPYSKGDMSAPDSRPKLRDCLRHRYLAKLVQRIICRSEGVREAFLHLGVPDSRLAVADGGCDTEVYRFRSDARIQLRGELNIRKDDLVLGVSCRLVPIKRLDRLIRLVSSMGTAAPKLVIVGDGPERGRLESLAIELKMGDQIFFLGQRDDLVSLYSAFDIFCLPSESEGMSNSILEAMSCLLPVVASDIPANRGLVQSGKTGELISFEDIDEFRRNVRILQNRSTREMMGRFGRAHVESKYSLAARLRKEYSVYQEVLGNS